MALVQAAPPVSAPPPPREITPLPSFGPLVKKVMPAVVNIQVTMRATPALQQEAGRTGPGSGRRPTTTSKCRNFPASPFDQFLRRFFQQQQQA